mmetsp:Transcript_120274/g.218578  ORF Transcript_120274/g.218578 Transcript_120274/m.218578 type:complete len:201 (+) Transcript_120274:643-1245(+)
MDTARAEAALRDLEAAALAQEDVANGYPHVVQDDLCMVVNVTEHPKWSPDGHTRRISRDEHHGVAVVEFAAGALGDSEHDEDLALGTAGATDVPLVAVDDVLVSVTHKGGADVCRITARHSGLCHCICAADGSLQQWLEPLLLLLLCPVLLQHLHVACVRSRAVHGNIAYWESTEDLADGRVLQHTEFANLGKEEVVQAA